MIQHSPQVPPAPKKTHWLSILVLINSMAGLLFFFGIAGSSFISGLITLFSPETSPNEAAVMLSYSAAGLFLCALLVPPITLSIKRIGGSRTFSSNLWHKALDLLHPKKIIWFYPLVILVGHWINNLPSINWLVMPVLNILGIGLPVAWLVWAGSRQLSSGSLQRRWGVFSIGFTASPLMIIILEILIMLVGFLLLAFLLSTVFTGTDLHIEELISTLTDANENQQFPEQEILGFIRQPAILAMILFFVSGIVPLIEEIFKPIAVWLLWRKPLTPQAGWVLGLLSGAGFALVEGLGNSTVGEGWAFLVLARGGASALHIFNTALISYTVVLARKNKRFLPALLAVPGTILIHSLWNGITILATLSSLEGASADSSAAWPLGLIFTLAAISFCMVLGIVIVNRRLAAKNAQRTAGEPDSETSPPEAKHPETIESE